MGAGPARRRRAAPAPRQTLGLRGKALCCRRLNQSMSKAPPVSSCTGIARLACRSMEHAFFYLFSWCSHENQKYGQQALSLGYDMKNNISYIFTHTIEFTQIIAQRSCTWLALVGCPGSPQSNFNSLLDQELVLNFEPTRWLSRQSSLKF